MPCTGRNRSFTAISCMWEKLSCMKCVRCVNPLTFRFVAALRMDSSSQSIPKSFPLGPVFSNMAAAWPPFPIVQSIKFSFFFGSSRRSISSVRTGMCMLQTQLFQTFCHISCFAFDFLFVFLPCRAPPDFNAVIHPCNHDFFLKLRIGFQIVRNKNSSQVIELYVHGS